MLPIKTLFSLIMMVINFFYNKIKMKLCLLIQIKIFQRNFKVNQDSTFIPIQSLKRFITTLLMLKKILIIINKTEFIKIDLQNLLN